MNRSAQTLFVLFGPLLLLSACGSGQQRSVNLLNNRLQLSMEADIAANRVALQPVPGGARVTLLDTSLFADNRETLVNQNVDPRASMVEGMLDPNLMRVQIEDTSQLPDDERLQRVQNLEQFMLDFNLGQTLQTAEVAEGAPQGVAAGAPAGLVVTIAVFCPPPKTSGYGSGQSAASCQ